MRESLTDPDKRRYYANLKTQEAGWEFPEGADVGEIKRLTRLFEMNFVEMPPDLDADPKRKAAKYNLGRIL